MLRLVSVLVAVAVITLPLMPVQWAAVALKRPLRRLTVAALRGQAARTAA